MEFYNLTQYCDPATVSAIKPASQQCKTTALVCGGGLTESTTYTFTLTAQIVDELDEPILVYSVSGSVLPRRGADRTDFCIQIQYMNLTPCKVLDFFFISSSIETTTFDVVNDVTLTVSYRQRESLRPHMTMGCLVQCRAYTVESTPACIPWFHISSI